MAVNNASAIRAESVNYPKYVTRRDGSGIENTGNKQCLAEQSDGDSRENLESRVKGGG